MGMMMEASKDGRERKADELVRAVEKEMEPLLAVKDAGAGASGPYFGGSERLTLAEVCRCVFCCCFIPVPLLPPHHAMHPSMIPQP